MRQPVRTLTVLGCLLALLGGCSSGTQHAAPPRTTTASSAPSTSGPVTTPAPAPTTAADREAAVATAVGRMDRRARVAQLFVAGVRLDALSSGAQVAGTGVGGIFLAGRSTASAADLAATVGGWQSAVPGPRLWVAADQEGGQVQTLRGPGFDVLPTALQQGALPAADLRALADRLGASLAGAGLNLDLAPVADVVPAGTEQANPPIGVFSRQYGSTPDAVVAAAGIVVGELAAHGVTATLKHFPGLGSVQQNTDTSANVVDGVTTAGDGQVTAFGRLAGSAGRPVVMVSSAVYTRIDPTAQAVFSPVVVTDLLRTQLGFGGVIMTDDVGTAQAVQAVPAGERAVRFLAAGGTLVLTVDAGLVPAMIDAVLTRSDSDPAFAAQVDAALHAALLAKAGAGLLPPGS